MKLIHKIIIIQIILTTTAQVYYVRKLFLSVSSVSDKIVFCNRAKEEQLKSIRSKISYLADLIERNKADVELLKIQNETDSEYNSKIDKLHETVKEINIRIKEK